MSTKGLRLNVKISIVQSSRHQDPNSNSIIEYLNLLYDTLNCQKYQNIKNLHRKVTDFF